MINKVILVGNVGADPEIRTLEGGAKVARIRLATTERIYNRQTQEARDHTEWHTITLWNNLANFADRFVKKGSQIYVEGKIRSREWTDQNGGKRNAIEIVADDMKLMGRRSDNPGGQGTAPGQQAAPYQNQYVNNSPAPMPSQPEAINTADDIDDLPF